MVSDTLGCVFGCINQEVSVKSFMIDQVALYHDTIIKELSGISGLLPSYVPKGVIKQLLLETNDRPAFLRLANTESGQFGEPSLYNLKIFE